MSSGKFGSKWCQEWLFSYLSAKREKSGIEIDICSSGAGDVTISFLSFHLVYSSDVSENLTTSYPGSPPLPAIQSEETLGTRLRI